MEKDDKALDADSAEALELSNFDDALVAGLASDFESTDSASAEDGDDKDKKEDSSSDKSKSEDARTGVEDEEEEKHSEGKGEDEDKQSGEDDDGKSDDLVIKLPAAPVKFPDLKEGDYVKNEDGTYIVNDDILAQDISDVLDNEAGIYLRIYRAKPEKAEAMAKIMGFTGDETRTPGRQMADVVRALGKGDKGITEALLVKHFPYLLDPNTPAPFSYAEGVKTSRENNAEVVVSEREGDPGDYTEDELKTAIYRVVAESGGKIKLEDIKMEDLEDEMSLFKYDIKTGKPLPLYERLSLAVGEKLQDNQEDEDDDVRKVRVGGSRKKSNSKSDNDDPELKAFTDALGSQMGSIL